MSISIQFYVTGLDKAGSTVTETGFQGNTSVITQIVTQPKKYATFEENCFKLDGSWDCAGDSIESLMSDSLSNENGKFTVNPIITIEFNEPKDLSKGLTIDFTDVYCKGFIVTYYDSLDTVLLSKTVTDNNNRYYSVGDNIQNVSKITIEITETLKANRYARISNIEYGARIVFDDNDIIKSELLNEADPTANEIPESILSFEVVSQNDDFSITNPAGVYAYLRDNLPVVLSVNGKEKGRFYLTTWKQTGINTFSFKATDVIGYLKNQDYKGSKILSDDNLSYVVSDIFADTGANVSYSIDDNLTANLNNFIAPSDCISALGQVLVRSGGFIYVSQNGAIHIGRPFTSGDTTQTVIYGEMLGEPTIQQNQLVDGFDIEFCNIQYGETETFTATFECSDKVIIDFANYSKGGYICTSYTVTGYNVSSDEKRVGCLVLYGSGEGTATIAINCKKVDTVTGNAIKTATQGKKIQLSGNTLIDNIDTANTVGNNLLDLYSNRLLYKFKIEYNENILIGGYITVKDQYDNTVCGNVQKISTDITGGMLQEIEVLGKNV